MSAPVLELTVFPDVNAFRAASFRWSLDELVEQLRNVGTYPDKGSCRLIKLARFGDKRTDKKSLRHDPNVIEVTGIEGDYDGEVVDMGEAQTMLADAGLTAVLYTSPSHAAGAPRWRVLCPLSRPYPPKDRERFVARLNGAMGGILAAESYTLSQSYYYGRVCDDYAVVRVTGRFIDEADELDAKAVPAPKNGESKAERLEQVRSNDPVVKRLAERGMVIRQRTDGAVDITCPFESNHTGKGGNGETTYFLAHTGGFTQGHFHCFHSHCKGRTDAEFLAAIGIGEGKPATPAGSGKRFPRLWLDDAQVELTNTYIVKHLIDSKTFILIYGPSGQGKTFFTIDLAEHIARGMPWRGRRVRGCLVVYIAAEAGASIVKRFVAARAREGAMKDKTPLSIFTRGADLLNLSDVEALMLELKETSKEAGMPIGLVIFDTYSRSTPGGKEDAEDTSAAIGVVDRLRDELGAATVFVHHSGKDLGKGARGHSSLFAAADTVICVEGNTTAIVSGCVAEVEKSRDGSTGEQIPFRLDVVDLGQDEDGEPVTTCVVVPTDTGTAKPRSVSLSGVAKVALQALREAIDAGGKVMAGSSTIPKGARAVEITAWRDRFTLRYGTDGKDKRDVEAIRKAFNRGREALLKAVAIGISNPYAWVIE